MTSHTPHSLDALFRPTTVAVIGASDEPGSIGQILIRNLTASSFGGAVFPINPKRRAVRGIRAYARVADVPDPVDLAIVATPASSVPGLIGECLAAAVKAAIIISAGFRETGPEGRRLEEEILRLVRPTKLRVLGPNCLGLIHPPTGLNASFAAAMARPGHVALVSQSGALCTSILDWSLREQVGFSAFVSVGSMLDVDFAALVDYLGDDPKTHSIVIYMESIGDARGFLSAAREVALTKPIIVVKAGRSPAAAKAATSHTGALAGADDVFEAAFQRAGILRVDEVHDLFSMTEVLAKQPQPHGPRLAVVTNAGGPGVMATDALVRTGGQLAELSSQTVSALDRVLPPYWSRGNPIDVLGDATPERYRQAFEAAADDPAIDGFLVILTPQAMTDAGRTAEELRTYTQAYLKRAGGPSKPLLASWMGGADIASGREILNRAGIPTFETPEEAVRAFVYMHRYARNLQLLYETPAALPVDWAPDRRRAAELLASVRSRASRLLTELEAKQVLQCYGIPTVPTHLAATPDDAVRLADQIGYPVVLKLLSETVTHKSDVGGVRLDLTSAAQVRQAYHEIVEAVARRFPDADIQGTSVQPMVRQAGHELIIGSTTDPLFGPVLLFGLGGTLVEVFRDRALALPPLNRTLARRMMEQTRVYHALKGVRGARAVDLDALEELLVRFSQLVCDFPEITEFDVNPLLAGPEGLIALDARALVAPADVPADRLPKPAIRPYPNQYESQWCLMDGTEVMIRPIRPEDEPLMQEMFATFSERTIRMRFFHAVKRFSHEAMVRFCHIDYDRQIALVAMVRAGDAPSQAPYRLIGVARIVIDADSQQAEFAVEISDPWQGRGLGRHLVELLLDFGRDRRLRTIFGDVLAENQTMLTLCREVGFKLATTADPAVMRAVYDLGGAAIEGGAPALASAGAQGQGGNE